MEKQKIIFDKKNCTLVIDSIELCTAEEISKWVNSHISDVLDSGISRSYLTGKLEVTVMVVCHDYLVALYRISDNSPDEFIIQPVGYDKALRQSEAAEEQSVPVEYSEPSETSNQNEEIRCSYDVDGNLCFELGDELVCVKYVDMFFDEIESLKCLLDKHFITVPEFYLAVHRRMRDTMNLYELPF